MESTTGGLRFIKQSQKRMLDYLTKSEVLKVNARELEYHVLTPSEDRTPRRQCRALDRSHAHACDSRHGWDVLHLWAL